MGGQYRQFQAPLGSESDRGNEGRGTMNFYAYLDGRLVEQGRFPTPPATRRPPGS